MFGNGLAQGPEDPQAAVAMGRVVAVAMVVAVVRCRRQRGGRLLRPGPSAVLRSRHRRAARRGARGGAGRVQRLELALKWKEAKVALHVWLFLEFVVLLMSVFSERGDVKK